MFINLPINTQLAGRMARKRLRKTDIVLAETILGRGKWMMRTFVEYVKERNSYPIISALPIAWETLLEPFGLSCAEKKRVGDWLKVCSSLATQTEMCM